MNIKADESFNYKKYRAKFKYECRADNKFFFYCNAGYEKVVSLIRFFTFFYIHKKKLLDSRKFLTSGFRWIYLF